MKFDSPFPMPQRTRTGLFWIPCRTYEVSCNSSVAPTVSGTVVDSSGGLNNGTYSLLFTAADGVQDGTDYSCSVTLETGGYTSASSQPSMVSTLNTLGKKTVLWHVGSCFWIPWPFSWKLGFSVVLGTLHSNLKSNHNPFFGMSFVIYKFIFLSLERQLTSQ